MHPLPVCSAKPRLPGSWTWTSQSSRRCCPLRFAESVEEWIVRHTGHVSPAVEQVSRCPPTASIAPLSSRPRPKSANMSFDGHVARRWGVMGCFVGDQRICPL